MMSRTRDEPTPWVPCFGILLALGAIVMVQPIFREIGLDFGVELTEVRLSFSYCSFAYAGSFFLLGPLTDRLSLTRIAAVSAIGLLVATAIAGLSKTFLVFNVGMVGIGVSAAGVVSPMFPYMGRSAPSGKAGVYLGLCLSATVTGLIVGRTAIGLLTDFINWRISMLAYCLPVLLWSIACYRLTPLPGHAGHGSSIFEQYVRAFALLRVSAIVRRYAAGFLLFFAYLGTLTFLTFYLLAPPFELSVGQIGWISLAGIGGAVVAPKAGALAQTHGANRVVRTGVVLVLLGIGLMLLVHTTPAVVLGVFAIYCGVYVCQPAVFYDVTTMIAPEQMGAASSLYLLGCLSGGSLGSYLLGPIWLRWGWTGVMLTASAATLGTLALGTTGGPRQVVYGPKAVHLSRSGTEENRT